MCLLETAVFGYNRLTLVPKINSPADFFGLKEIFTNLGCLVFHNSPSDAICFCFSILLYLVSCI